MMYAINDKKKTGEEMLKKLYVELSSACNLHCDMCFRKQWFDEKPALMSDECVDKLCRVIAQEEFETLFIGGMGEPMLHPRLYEVIREGKRQGKYVEMITNATMLTGKAAKDLQQSGLDRLWVSMDGFSRESYESIRKGSLYDQICENILGFREIAGTTELGIAFVMLPENERELSNINEFCDQYGVDIINLSHVVPTEPLAEDNSIYDKDYPVGKMNRLTKGKHKKTLDCCPFIADGVCFIRSDGEVCPCMQLLHNSYTYLYTEKRKVYAHSFGNILKTDFADIWNSESYCSFRKAVTDFEFPCCTICLGCEDRLENQKDCMYNRAPTCGACLWAQGIARCP